MLIKTFKVCGLGSSIKKSKVKEIISSNSVELMTIKEIKFSEVSDSLVNYLCGNLFCE